MATIPVWEAVNKYKLMMKTHSQLILTEDLVFYLVLDVIEQVTQFHGHLRPVRIENPSL